MEMPVSPSPVPPTVYVPESGGKKLFSKRNILLMLFLLVMVGALPVGLYLVQKTQIFKSKAASVNITDFIKVPNAVCTETTEGLDCTTSQTGRVTITLQANGSLNSQFPSSGAAATPTPVPGTTSTPAPAATSTPTAPTATTAPGAVKPTNLRSQCIDSTRARLSWYGNADYPIARYTFGPENGTGWSPYESLPTNVHEVTITLPDAEFTYGWRVSFVGTNVYEQGASFRCGASNLIPTAVPVDEPATGGDN